MAPNHAGPHCRSCRPAGHAWIPAPWRSSHLQPCFNSSWTARSPGLRTCSMARLHRPIHTPVTTWMARAVRPSGSKVSSKLRIGAALCARRALGSPNGTAIEGEWEPVFAAIEACHHAVHAMGCPRVYSTVKINTRTDKEQTLEDKVASVQALL